MPMASRARSPNHTSHEMTTPSRPDLGVEHGRLRADDGVAGDCSSAPNGPTSQRSGTYSPNGTRLTFS